MIGPLKDKFEPILTEFLQTRPVQAVLGGDMTVAQYRSIMRQVFHHTRENPQLQALATVYFRGRDRDMVRPFFKHAASEIGHDQLALNDFTTLGGDPTTVPYENPLPATTALLAYGFYQIYNLNPLGYLGYLFFLEFTPVQTGEGMMARLRDLGVPDNAMTFLRDHTEIDVGHTKLMEKYAATLIKDDRDVDCVAYAIKTTGHLYAEMMSSAMDAADKAIDTGWNWEELNADGVSSPDELTRASTVASTASSA
ncbi:MAG: iron-containing redox enzyme family protein [Pseudomonadota bacterium]